MTEITREISSSKTRKAAVPDCVTNEVLKQTFGIIFPMLLMLFNRCFRNSECPKVWRTSYLKPLYKGKGRKTDPNSYGGISLLSCTFKVYSGILYRRLAEWADRFKMLRDNQFGFRRGLSTMKATNTLIGDIKRRLCEKRSYYIAFVDFEKAFHTVNPAKLSKKLRMRGIPKSTANIIKKIWMGTNIKVAVANKLSAPIRQEKGVPQGDRLSPLFFAFYIADLPGRLGANAFFTQTTLRLSVRTQSL